MEAKSILAVHDLSCRGAASLGIVIPVLTALGHKVTALPSVVLSSTTDLDQEPVALNTTEWWYKVLARWEAKKIGFDAIFTGWLGDPEQVSILIDLCKNPINKKATIFVDPVLGDGGCLYPCQENLAKKMHELVALADVITPNPTEAAILVGKKPKDCGIQEDGTIDLDKAEELLYDLHDCYPKALPILKSVVHSNDLIGVLVLFTPENTFRAEKRSQVILGERAKSGSIGGTGDLFASLLIGKWLKRINGQSGEYEKTELIQWVIWQMSQLINKNTSKDLPFRNLLSCV